MKRTLPVMVALLVFGSFGCKGKYIRPITEEKVESTPERLTRGGYLVNQVMSCGGCHTGRDTGNVLTEPERTDMFLGGANFFKEPGIGTVWVPNITPDPETGIGKWKDDEIMRVIRDGVDRDGKFMAPIMPFPAYQHLADEDLRAIVVYLRSVPPYRQAKPRQKNKLEFMAMVLFKVIGVQMHMPAANVHPPDRANKVSYGQYLARIGSCVECHSMGEKGPRPETDPLFLAGSDKPFEDPDLGKVWARNLTPDVETGLGKYDAAAIKAAIRSGVRLDGKKMAAPMSIVVPHVSGMVDEDLDALVAYLKSVPAAKSRVPDRVLAGSAKKAAGE